MNLQSSNRKAAGHAGARFFGGRDGLRKSPQDSCGVQGHESLRDNAASYVLEALEAAFGKGFSFGPKALPSLRKGMHDGRALLQDFYKKRIDRDLWPNGLESRFKALGW